MRSLAFGEIVFDVNHITYQQLTKSLKIRWVKQARINQAPVLQNTGIDSQTVTISGVCFNQYQKSNETLKKLNDIALKAEPHFLIGLDGMVYGRWVLESILQEMSDQHKTSYTLSLIQYDLK